jgi:hypothetical protein
MEEFVETDMKILGGNKFIYGKTQTNSIITANYTINEPYLFNCISGSLKLKNLTLKHPSSTNKNTLIIFSSKNGELEMDVIKINNIGIYNNNRPLIDIDIAKKVTLTSITHTIIEFDNGGMIELKKANTTIKSCEFDGVTRNEGNGSCVKGVVSFNILIMGLIIFLIKFLRLLIKPLFHLNIHQ